MADSKFVVNYFRFSDDHRMLFGGTESYGYRFPADIATAVLFLVRDANYATGQVLAIDGGRSIGW